MSCAATALHVGKGAELTRETDARFEVVETRGGMVIGVRRPAEAGHSIGASRSGSCRSTRMIPPYGDNALNGHAWVPIDDENCMVVVLDPPSHAPAVRARAEYDA